RAELRYWQNEPGSRVRRAFEAFVRSAFLRDLAPETALRLTEGARFTQTTLDGSRTFDQNNIASFVLPLIAAIVFVIALFIGASYLLESVVDEKENRTIEIVVSSVAPMQLMAGKVIGLAGVGLTQVVVWVAGAGAAVFLLRDRLEFLQNLTVDMNFVALAFVLFSLQYLIFGGIMAGLGSIVADTKQAQSYAVPFTITAMAPLLFLSAILFDPNGAIAIVLSLFPLTSPLTLLVRYSMTSIPPWQIILATALLIVTAIASLWLAGRIFRIGMLRFGQRLNVSEIAASIRF
ncbi:MAG: ABC transporter permease, partial [Anaerolineae bacterium]|nr:ABC transporter permease [Thermoflexales bacterium]MDW8407900.1 ABC transporter permease [Anaerolineae bacterium]